MAKIYIRGHSTPQIVSVQTAKIVDEIKDDKTKDNNYYIRLDGFSCDKGDVKSVIIYDSEDDKSTRNNQSQIDNGERIEEYNNNFINEIRNYANGNLEKKLQFNLKVAKMYCFALTGKDIEEYKPQLKIIFIEELKKERLIVNPTKYLKLFKPEDVISNSDLININYIIRKSPIRIMQNYLSNVYKIIK